MDENIDVYEEEENLIYSWYVYKFFWCRCEFKIFILWYVLLWCINYVVFNCIKLSEIELLLFIYFYFMNFIEGGLCDKI